MNRLTAVRRSRIAPAVASVLAAVMFLFVLLPKLTGTTWTASLEVLAALRVREVMLLTTVWLVGLFTYTFVMLATLPSLGHRRAMMLNFSGSAVANVLPFGGVAALGVNYSMLRSWGFSRTEFSLLTLLTNVWSVLARLVLPSIALCTLAIAGEHAGHSVVVGSTFGLGLVVVALVGLVAVMRRPRRGAGDPDRRSLAGRLMDRVISHSTRDSLVDLHAETYATIKQRWHQLTLGTVAYAGMQVLLLGMCLHMLGVDLSAADVFAGFAVGGIMTLIPLTPGGVGMSETGMAAVLVALGGEPAATTAAVLLFRSFTYLLEIPVGAACGAAWWLRRVATP